jgi:hypothetical protein
VDTTNADSSSRANLIQQIRFGIQCLNDRNGHHEFEEAWRHFARLRITLNILPATGPVGAGGDQGRDFESFRTFIQGLGAYKFAGVGGRKRREFCDLKQIIGVTCTAVPSGSPFLAMTRTRDLCEREQPSFPARSLPQTHRQMKVETML